jgi:hypothetical protein
MKKFRDGARGVFNDSLKFLNNIQKSNTKLFQEPTDMIVGCCLSNKKMIEIL